MSLSALPGEHSVAQTPRYKRNARRLAFVVTGIPLAITTPDGNITRFGVLLPALAWPVVAAIA